MAFSKTVLLAVQGQGFAAAVRDAGYLVHPMGSVDSPSSQALERPLAILLDLDQCRDEDWRRLETWHGRGHLISVGGRGSVALRMRAAQWGCVTFLDEAADIGPILALLHEITGSDAGPAGAGAGRVLLVDADPASGLVASRLLEDAGFDVTCLADTGRLLVTLATGVWDLLAVQPGPSLPDANTLAHVLGGDPWHDGMSTLMLPTAGEGQPLEPADLVPAVTARILASRRRVGAMFRDLMTGGCRQAYFEVRLDDEIDRATRQGITLSLAVLSLRDFEAVVEREGREAQIRLVSNLIRTITASVRRTDMVCHLGEGCVAVMLLGATCEQAVVLLDTMRMGFGSLQHREGRSPLPIGFEAGVADLRQGRTRAQLFAAAGRALAAACEEDGNYIAVAEAT